MGTPLSDDARRLLGLARRARALSLGLRATLREVRNGKLGLVLLASDASARTSGLARGIGVPVVVVGDLRTLGEAAGTTPVAVIGVRRGSFTARLAELLGIGPT